MKARVAIDMYEVILGELPAHRNGDPLDGKRLLDLDRKRIAKSIIIKIDGQYDITEGNPF